ncbi:hypothetical protein DPMN_129262 [Dreissena polymorpha]|uniref:Uncharacterized protein n=1 Tax=Dreissena polymorpha TaxID=45954 RepID=A0A9D4JWH1_DREPO|nr:hypothetical protein DPMN_129262 [Dreissena polymorpha]
MMQVMRNPQRCRRTDSPSAHCDCAIPSDAGEPIVPRSLRLPDRNARLLCTLKVRYLRVQELVHWLG